MRIFLTHGDYGCESGCCGHWIEIEGERPKRLFSSFSFSHPYLWRVDDKEEGVRKFIQDVVREELGEEYLDKIDYTQCVVEDC